MIELFKEALEAQGFIVDFRAANIFFFNGEESKPVQFSYQYLATDVEVGETDKERS